jgi:hypothetical protein
MKPEATHFVINDMGIVMSHSPKSREYFFGMLIAMTEEGVKTMASPDGIETIKTGRKGIIACITSDQARDARAWWQKRGLARRLIPFHFQYADSLIVRIKDTIVKKHHISFEEPKPTYPKMQLNVSLDSLLSQKIRLLSDRKAPLLGQLGISLLLRYQALAKGHALFRNWKNAKVTDDDIEFLSRIDPYIDWMMPGLFL